MNDEIDQRLQPDPAVAHLPEGLQRGFGIIKARRQATQFGGSAWTPDKLCQATAKSTGKQCQRVPVQGQRFCIKHGGGSCRLSKERRKKRGQKGAFSERDARSFAQKRLDAWASSCQKEFGGARAALASLTDRESTAARHILDTVWEFARYRNRKGWRAATWLVLEYVAGNMVLEELKRQWGIIDPGVDEYFVVGCVPGGLIKEPSTPEGDVRQVRPTIAPYGCRIDGVEFGGVPYTPTRKTYEKGGGGW